MVGFLKDLILTREIKSVTSITKGLGFLITWIFIFLSVDVFCMLSTCDVRHTSTNRKSSGLKIKYLFSLIIQQYLQVWAHAKGLMRAWHWFGLVDSSLFPVSYLHQTHNLWLWFYGRMQFLRQSHKVALRGRWRLETLQSITLDIGEAARHVSNSKTTQYTSAQCLQQFRLLTEIQTMLHEAAPVCHSCDEVRMTHTSEAYLHVQNV